MHAETELKLLIKPGHVALLRRQPLFKRASHVASHRLRSVYFDTPEFELWDAGISLRLRRDGHRWIQTVYSGGAAAGLHIRNDTEAEITTPVPDFSALADADVAARFVSRRLRARLKPMIVVDGRRWCCVLTPASGVAIQASIDRGSIRCGDASEPICELELEIKAGPPWRCYQTALQLLTAVPLQVEDRSRAERGVALHRGIPRRSRKAGASPISADMSSNRAFSSLVRACLVHFVANQRGMLAAEDPEYLHQMRVALRRLRSVFGTFAPLFPRDALAEPAQEARWLAGALGPARDWDVFAVETLPPIVARYKAHTGLSALTCSVARLRAAASRAARRSVASARGQGLLLALGGWLSAETWLTVVDGAPAGSKQGSRLRDAHVRESGAAPSSAGAASGSRVASRKRVSLRSSYGRQRSEMSRPVSGFARTVLVDAHQRVLKRGRNFSRLQPVELHRLRIAAKKLRYAAEFFAPLYEERRTRNYRAALVRLHDGLGAFNDAATITTLAALACRDLKGPYVREARGIVLGWSAGMQDAGMQSIKRIWKEFRAASPFWE